MQSLVREDISSLVLVWEWYVYYEYFSKIQQKPNNKYHESIAKDHAKQKFA